jgi:hypothetical protein
VTAGANALMVVLLSVPLRAPAPSLVEHFVSMMKTYVDAKPGENGRGPISILRMDMDVTKDGVAEIFLSASSTGGNQGLLWVVYTRQDDGRYRPLGVITLGAQSFFYSASRSVIFATRHVGQGRWGCSYFHVSAAGVRELLDG